MEGATPGGTVGGMSRFESRVALFQEALRSPVDFNRIRELAFRGIPDSPGLRSIYWKLLLGYLPSEVSEWPAVLQKNKQTYQDFIDELIIDPRSSAPQDDHPLNTSQTSQWNAFFKDKETLEEIDKDVKRTLPHLHFFNHDKTAGDTTHYEALKRILFIYAKLNPGIKYVQGMNEILGPVYYIFASDPNPQFKENAEVDTFFCFTNLMAEIRDNFCKTLDKSSLGITGLIAKLNNILREKDLELWENLEEKKLNPQFYSFRWLTLLLSQEFDLPDVLRLWDSLFADPYRFNFLLYTCCAMLVCLREELMDGSFADNLKLLQNYPIQDINIILQKAEEIEKGIYVPPPRRPPKPAPVAQSPNSKKRAVRAEKTVDESSNWVVVETQENEIYEEEEPIQPPAKLVMTLPKPFDADEEEDTTAVKTHPLE